MVALVDVIALKIGVDWVVISLALVALVMVMKVDLGAMVMGALMRAVLAVISLVRVVLAVISLAMVALVKVALVVMGLRARLDIQALDSMTDPHHLSNHCNHHQHCLSTGPV